MWMILLILVGIGILTFLGSKIAEYRKGSSDNPVSEESRPLADIDCCGAHEICDKDTLLSTSDDLVYYDDEELDRYKGLAPGAYNKEQIEEFRDVLFTMRDDEVAGWLRSLPLRNVQLPTEVREEALMIVADVRDIIRGNKQMAAV